MLFSLPPLLSLHAFEAAARLGSFSAAAKELNITQSAISHRIRQLESHLGYELFERLARGLILNDMGKAYLPSIQHAFNEITSSTAGLFASGEPSTVTIRVPITHAVLWLAPRLESFLDEFPDIDVRIASSIWSDLLPQEAADLELRFGDGNWSDSEVTLLHQEFAIPVCSALHIEQFGRPKSLQQLAGRKRINTLGYDILWARLFRNEVITNDKLSNSIWVDTTLAAIELAAAGTRCAIIPASLLKSEVIRNRLFPVWDVSIKMNEAFYLLTPTAKRPISPQAQLFKQWLLQQM